MFSCLIILNSGASHPDTRTPTRRYLMAGKSCIRPSENSTTTRPMRPDPGPWSSELYLSDTCAKVEINQVASPRPRLLSGRCVPPPNSAPIKFGCSDFCYAGSNLCATICSWRNLRICFSVTPTRMKLRAAAQIPSVTAIGNRIAST